MIYNFIFSFVVDLLPVWLGNLGTIALLNVVENNEPFLGFC